MSASFWADAPRENFTARCAFELNASIPVDEISNETITVYQRRGDLLATLIGLHNATSYAVLKSAEVRRAA